MLERGTPIRLMFIDSARNIFLQTRAEWDTTEMWDLVDEAAADRDKVEAEVYLPDVPLHDALVAIIWPGELTFYLGAGAA